MGNANQYSSPSAVYRTIDDHFVSLSGSTNALFACNARAIGREDLLNEPQFLNNTLRVSNSKELNKIFSNWIAKNTLSDVLKAFEAAQGTISPINSIEQIVSDPQMIYRKAIIDVADADFGSVKLSGVVPRFRNDPCEVRNTAGSLGQDNSEIYETILGLSIKEQDELRHRGVI